MAMQTPSWSHCRVSLCRLIEPSLCPRQAEQLREPLALSELNHYYNRAEKALAETIAAYRKANHTVDRRQWKCLRSRHGVRLFRERHSLGVERIPLLCVGALRGSFDDIMEGLYCEDTEEMLLTNAIKCPRLADSAVLHTVRRQTMCEPYAFTGIKRVTIKLPVASNRDLCYFDKMGLVRQTLGKRMAYHVMQSVDLPEYPHKAMHKRVKTSMCYVFEELEDDLVGVYMQGEMDHATLSYFSIPAVSDLLLAVTNASECTRAKKLAEMMSVAPPGRFRRRSSHRRCDVCRGNTPSFFGNLQECAGCNFKHVCNKCRLKENVLVRDTASRSRLVCAEFCRVCISKMESTSIGQLRANGGNIIVAGQRTAIMSGACYESEKESEDADIPGSDRSLTAFTLKISTQLQDLSSSSDICISNFSSMEKVLISEDEDDDDNVEHHKHYEDDDDEDALLGEGRDVLNSIGKKSSQLSALKMDLTDTTRRSSRSTTSTASSHYLDDDETEQYRASLFARLQQVSNQAEATLHLTKEQSLLAHAVFQCSRRTQWSDKSVFGR